jgi:hypothetical protein
MLYLAGIILLWHNFVPHHHAEVSSTLHQIHAQELKQDHEHEHNVNHSHDKEGEDDHSSDNPFSIPLHSQTLGDALIKQSSPSFFTIAAALDYFIPNQVSIFSPPLVTLLKIPFARNKSSNLNSSYFPSHALRGPPYRTFS